MTKEISKETRVRMEHSIEDFHRKLATVRTGRASTGLLDGITVDYYGTQMPLNQVSTVHAPEASLLTVQPFDPTLLKEIESAIRKADLGLNPSNDGKLIRVPIPPLTEERREQLAKKASQLAEEGRTAIRQIRREANDEAKKLEKDKTLSQDDARRLQQEVQKRTDKAIASLDEAVAKKEKEILEV